MSALRYAVSPANPSHSVGIRLAGHSASAVYHSGTPTEPLGLHLAGMMLNSGGFFCARSSALAHEKTSQPANGL